MKITSQFNKFYHVILTDLWNKARSLRLCIVDIETGEVQRLVDDETGGSFIVYKNEDYDSMGDIDSKTSLKHLLKLLNAHYPKVNDQPISTNDLTNEVLLQHLYTIEEIANINNITLTHIEEELRKFKQLYKGLRW